MTQAEPQPTAMRECGQRAGKWLKRHVSAVTCAAVILGAAVVVTLARPSAPPHSAQPLRYLGVYEASAPRSYAGVDAFAHAIGKQPNLACYYSKWLEPFQAGFATSAAEHGAVPLVQINPAHVSLTAIASGQYDAYLRSYAAAVRSYHRRVILSFGHEMNGWWYSWGYLHSSPATFVAAWRHIVTLFRGQGAGNVTWLWTINIINPKGGIPAPAPWWPGSSYVSWVGIDGYYFKSSWRFAPLFGPTIKAVHALTRAPILIAETGAAPAMGQPAKIGDLFAGIRAYGLLGFVWFNAEAIHDWRLNSPAAITAFRQGVKVFRRSEP
jgi:mannan endo-1,4-beta-mannosidase